jgi:hypothetical protein
MPPPIRPDSRVPAFESEWHHDPKRAELATPTERVGERVYAYIPTDVFEMLTIDFSVSSERDRVTPGLSAAGKI